MQLGMMVIAVGLSSYNIALFHLVNHAFYKGLLFLGAGAVIHAWADNQDFRKYGALRVFLPLTYTVMLIASLSLVAFPFMTGFYSKDFILESAYGHYSFSSLVIYFLATIGAMFTTLYSVKVLYLTFLTNPNGPLINYNKAHEGDIFMSIPLIILALFSIFFGYLTKDIFIGLASGFFSDNSLFIHPSHEIMLDTELSVHSFFKLLPLALTISLIIVSLVLSEYMPSRLIYFKFSRLGYNTFSFFNQRFLIELLYNKYITGVIFKLGGHTTKVLDKGFVELIGPFGLEKLLLNVSTNIAALDSGVITSYALYILIGLLTYILIPYTSVINSSMLLLIILALYVNLSDLYKYSNWMYARPIKHHSFAILPAQSYFFKALFTNLHKFLHNFLKSVFNLKYIKTKLAFIVISCCMSVLVCVPFSILLNILQLKIFIILLKVVYAALIYFVIYNLKYKGKIYKGPHYLNYLLVMLTALAFSTVIYLTDASYLSVFLGLFGWTAILYANPNLPPYGGGGPWGSGGQSSSGGAPAAPSQSTSGFPSGFSAPQASAAAPVAPQQAPAGAAATGAHAAIPGLQTPYTTTMQGPGGYQAWAGYTKSTKTPPAGTPNGAHVVGKDGWEKAGQKSDFGPLQADNPHAQPDDYNLQGTNQPRASCLADSLKRQRDLGVTRLNNKFFTESDRNFFLSFLRVYDPDMYGKIVHNLDTTSRGVSWTKMPLTHSVIEALRRSH